MRQCIMPGCSNSVTTYGRIVCDQCYGEGKQAMSDKIKREQSAKMPAYPRD